MASGTSTGDFTLSARTATAETFAPYGRLLGRGDRLRLARHGGVLVAVEESGPGPRRVTHLQRFPEAKRLVLPLGDVPMLVVVLGPGERPGGPPSAFRIPAGMGVLIDEGVWHAGPMALSETTVCEILETKGPADRMDRRTLKDLTGAEGIRVLLPEEPGARAPGFDLAQPNAVLLEASLRGRVRLACVAFRDLEVGESGAALKEEGDHLAEDLRSLFGPSGDPAQVPGVKAVRELFRDLGVRPEHVVPSSEALLVRVLEGKPLYRVNNLVDALNLCALKMRVPLAVHDADRIAEQVLVRPGAPGEGYPGIGRHRVSVEGRLVLCDREGPFGSLTGDALRTRVTPGTRRALVVLFLPAAVDRSGVEPLLEGVSRTVRQHCGGIEGGRLVVG